VPWVTMAVLLECPKKLKLSSTLVFFLAVELQACASAASEKIGHLEDAAEATQVGCV